MSKPSIVMLVSRNYAPDVQMVRVRRQAEALVKKGYRITVLCWARRAGLKYSEVAKEGFSVQRIYVPSSYGNFPIYIITMPVFQIKAFLHLLKNREFDIISAHDFDTLMAGVMAGKILQKPVVFDMHDQFYTHPGLNNLPGGKMISRTLRFMESVLVKNVDAVVVPGPVFVDEYLRLGARKVVFAPTSPSINFIPPDEVAKFPEDRFVINYMGTVREVEGFVALIKAAERIAPEVNTRVVIEIIGGGSTSITFRDVVSKAKSSGIEVILGDWIPYDALAKRYVAASMVYSMYSPRDGNASKAVGIKFMEAMAAGKPVMATRGTVMGDMAEDLGIGYSLEYASIEDISLAIKDAIENPDKIKEMGLRARKEFERNWTWEKSVERLDELYSSLG